MPTVTIGGRSVRLTSSQIVGSGGEADIYRLPGGQAVKLYKDDRHPAYVGDPNEQAGARARLALVQRKLPAFPQNLPPNVLCPRELVYDRQQQVIGFVLDFLDHAELLRSLSERSFREPQNIDTPQVLEIFRDLWQTVSGVHQAGVVIGDFNDLNVLFRGTATSLIDADSMQWGQFPCITFTQTFVDPVLCNPLDTALMLQQPHNPDSDWYAFAVMLMRSLLYVGPYGGIYKPADPSKRMNPPQRPLHRVTVFDPEVVYPRPAVPLSELPADLADYFQATFVHDKRGPFPESLLDGRLWTQKGLRVVQVLQPLTTVHGKVTATVIFATKGRIVVADIQRDQLLVLHHEDNAYRREDGRTVISGDYQTHLRYRLQGSHTLMAQGGQLMTLDARGGRTSQHVDQFGNLPIFDANGSHAYWLSEGRLMRSDAQVGSRPVGDVLANRTLMWTGPSFGFGFWHAGAVQQAFVFGDRSSGLNTTLQLEAIPGQLLAATTAFSDQQAWFLVQYQDKGKTYHRATVVDTSGQVITQATFEEPDEDHWLHTLYGHAAAGSLLFAATDNGIVAVRADANGFAPTLFPDTAPFVTGSSRLLALVENKQVNLLVVGERQIVRLAISA